MHRSRLHSRASLARPLLFAIALASATSSCGGSGGAAAEPTPPAARTPAPEAPAGTAASPRDGDALAHAAGFVSAPEAPTRSGNGWAYYLGTLAIADEDFLDPHGIDFEWAFSVRRPASETPRIAVYMHGSGGAWGAVRSAFAPGFRAGIEVRNVDAQRYDTKWREWWTFASDGVNYPGRRIAATLDYLLTRFPGATVASEGIILAGKSMGGTGAIIQTMTLPDPWRARIAYATGTIGVVMPRRIYQRNPGQYRNLPPDTGPGSVWDRIDFAQRARSDAIVRGMHYRHGFSTDDPFSAGPDGNTQLEFVNIVEANRIGGAFFWIRNGHSATEPGVNGVWIASFEVPEQDVTLDRAHPAITNSTGNYPLTAAQRVDEATYPRGHYNLGITWDHASIVDSADELVFPLKYQRRTDIGGGIPDQPESITVSVTPRRTRHFAIVDGETLAWRWDDGALAGAATVVGDTLTIDGIPLRSGDDYKRLQITR